MEELVKIHEEVASDDFNPSIALFHRLAIVVASMIVVGTLMCIFCWIVHNAEKKRKKPDDENLGRKSSYVYRSRDDEIVQKSAQAPVIDDDLPDAEGAQPVSEVPQAAQNEEAFSYVDRSLNDRQEEEEDQ